VYELVLSSTPSEVLIALLKDKQLVELHREPKDTVFAVGDIYLGKVRKVLPSLNAAFVNVGYEKDAFLHYFDLGPQVLSLNKFVKRTREGKEKTSNLLYFKSEADIVKTGAMVDVLSPGQEVLVQVAKEPISTKGPRIGSELSIPGRYLVLVPFSDRVSVSQKIGNRKEKERLKRLLKSIKPKNFGVIVRTNAQDKKVVELQKDLEDLLNKWGDIHTNLKKAKVADRVLGELSRTSAILRDVFNSDFSAIHVDNESLFNEVNDYMDEKAPKKKGIVNLYNSKLPIFEHFKISKAIKQSFGQTVTSKSGVYLVIEHTEACHVIDVNSGNRSPENTNQEENALAVNLEAAEEVARQLRLRDMGGIIVVDFIDMKKSANRKRLYQYMKDVMKSDRAKHSLTPPSRFGLIEITRQRVRPVTNVVTTEVCPSCKGTGKVDSSINLVQAMEGQANALVRAKNLSKIKISVHPYIESYLTKGIFVNEKKKIQKRIGVKVELMPMFDNEILEYHFYDNDGKELDVK
jgi:ribonuclease G